MNVYLRALGDIPPGETRSFMELAASAGRPGAARAAGRALSQLDAKLRLPRHRVVRADGSPPRASPGNPLAKLRREGARPRRNEPVHTWARRVGARLVGYYPRREYASPADGRVASWEPERMEPLADEATARARGFRPIGSGTPLVEPLPSARGGPRRSSLDRTQETKLERVPWSQVGSAGFVHIRSLLSPAQCGAILDESADPARFERSIDMGPRGYGIGAYHYYQEPLPRPAQRLRELLYRQLIGPANELWPRSDYPDELGDFWKRCRIAGQKRTSSILICYGLGGVNHLHRDIYGRVWFPYQALLMLSKRGRDFEGGEFVLSDDEEGGTERILPVSEGDVVVFSTRERFESTRGQRRRVPVRHGMKLLTRGKRYGVGLVFHLAE